MLWFDVETRIETTIEKLTDIVLWLWFDVETRIETTETRKYFMPVSCGLM